MELASQIGPGKEPVGPRGPLLLLHVDDDEDAAFLLRRALCAKQMAHWSFRHCAGGSEALDYLRRARAGELPVPAILLLDIKMPGVGGLDVLEWVQENMSEVPAIMLTSSELLEDRLRARDLGSKGYFEKSATFSEIIEFLRDWETQRSLAPDPDLARCASRAADEAASTAKENKALSFVRELRAPDPFYGTPVSFTRTDSTAC